MVCSSTFSDACPPCRDPSQIRLVGKVVVGLGVFAGLYLLYLPPTYETYDTLELTLAEREELVRRVEEFTGEDFPK